METIYENVSEKSCPKLPIDRILDLKYLLCNREFSNIKDLRIAMEQTILEKKELLNLFVLTTRLRYRDGICDKKRIEILSLYKSLFTEQERRVLEKREMIRNEDETSYGKTQFNSNEIELLNNIEKIENSIPVQCIARFIETKFEFGRLPYVVSRELSNSLLKIDSTNHKIEGEFLFCFNFKKPIEIVGKKIDCILCLKLHEEKKINFTVFYDGTFTDSEEILEKEYKSFNELNNFIKNLILYIEHNKDISEIVNVFDKKESKRSVQEKIYTKNPYIYVGRNFKNITRKIREETGEFEVKGHWRWQAYGVNHSLRRLQFISPYLKNVA